MSSPPFAELEETHMTSGDGGFCVGDWGGETHMTSGDGGAVLSCFLISEQTHISLDDSVVLFVSDYPFPVLFSVFGLGRSLPMLALIFLLLF